MASESGTNVRLEPYIERREAMFKTICDAAKSDEGWSKVKSSDGVDVYTMVDSESSLNKCKAKGLVQATLEQVEFLLTDSDIYKKIDNQAKCFEIMEQIDADHRIMYSHYRGMYTIADRDFVYFLGKKHVTEDGRKQFYYGTFSVEDPPKDLKKGVVRASINYSGWLVEVVDEPTPEEKKESGYKKDTNGAWCKLLYTGWNLRIWDCELILS